MKKRIGKILLSLSVCIVCVIAIFLGNFYFKFISERIYEDSTVHLKEIYGQVNRSFGAFVEKNWGLLYGWGNYISMTDGKNDGEVYDFISQQKEYWNFSELYLLSSDKTAVTPDGKKCDVNLEEVWKSYSENKAPVMAGATLPAGQKVTVFAVPVKHGKYKGVDFDAIAISYTNEDLSKSLKVDAFSGEAKCFIVHQNGEVLLSTQTGNSVFDNYLVYLKAASDLRENDFKKMKQDWSEEKQGLLQCNIGKVNHCILYQSVGYQDYVLLSVVPQNAVSAGFLSVQKTTSNVLIVIFLLICITIVTVILIRFRSQSRKSKTELKYRELMFNVLSNSVDDIFIMLDHENQSVDYISPNIERLLGISAQTACKNIKVMKRCTVNRDVIIPKSELEAIPLDGSKHWECEYMHQNTGERRWYRMTVYNKRILDIEKYIIVLSDRTHEQQMNQKMQEALTVAKSANEAKSNFLSNMSHDIRTPMNAIVGFSVLLDKNADQPDKVREYTRKITASSHHLLSLINDVLDMNKIESGKTSLNVDVFSLPEILDELNIIVMPQAKAKNQDFKMHVRGNPPERLIGDKLRLNQILLNLLSNAVKYTPDGGEINFSVCELKDKSKNYVRLQFIVSDNGIGISEEFQKHIFAPFSREISSVTNKIQGTGLGMAITKNLVDLMGGIISLDSAPDKGSTFTVELSFTLPDKEEFDMWFRSRISRMLVADDEKDICLNVQELMQDTGVEVLFSTNGSDAVEKAVKAHDEGRGFDVILLDWKMPGINGIEAARKIREKIGENVPILVLTSYDWSDVETEARNAGIDAFMSKPFFVSTFLHTIKPMFFEKQVIEEPKNETSNSIMDGCLFLVAEDNEINSEILTEMLAREGAKCELAVNGQEAVEMFKKSKPGYYDMIFMDVQMPIMNGYEATRQIRSCDHPEAKTIPIAAMTANTFAEDIRNALDSGMNGHLAKPIDMKAVRELTEQLLNKNKPQDV